MAIPQENVDYSFMAAPATTQYFPDLYTTGPLMSDFTHTTPQLGLNIAAVQYDTTYLPTRPHSSPSTFGPQEQDLVWTGAPHQGNRSHLLDAPATSFWNSTFPPVQVPTQRHRYSTSSASIQDIKNPQPRRPYQTLAPTGMSNSFGPIKRTSSDMMEDISSLEPSKIKRRKTSPVQPNMLPTSPELSDEDRLLLRLKDEEHVSWKDIAARFQTDLGKVYQVPALQMRLKRLRERLRVWTDADVTALRLAHDYWERSKFDIIAAKMVEFGAAEKWTGRQCQKKWLDMHQGADVYPTPGLSYASTSPIDQSTPGFPPFMAVGLPSHA